jgi:HSP20 family protein
MKKRNQELLVLSKKEEVMRKENIKPLYILIGLLFLALFVQGYFIYDLQKKESSLNIPISRSATHTNSYNADPFIEIQKIQELMMKEFGSFNSTFANDPFFKSAFSNTNMSVMSDIIEEDKEYIVELKIPGIDQQKINISNDGNLIHVSAQSNISNEKNDINYIHRESFGNYFKRSFTMPPDADLNTIKSTYEYGVLKITIQKRSK